MAGETGAVNGIHNISPDFEWNPDYDDLLEEIASTDHVDTEWTKLREVLKYKIDKNITQYLNDVRSTQTDTRPRSPESNPTLSPRTITSGGLRLPPFPKREVNEFSRNEYNSHGRQKVQLNEDEAQAMKGSIFAKFHEFEENPPFTIQRICELAVRPSQQYKYVGKYLRAVEKSLLVTSTSDAFPITDDNLDTPIGPTLPYSSSLRESSTPLFSPIPFLHEDARRSRSRSRSPPLSPLELTANRQLSPHPSDAAIAAVAVEPIAHGLDGRPAIGLVDELDDPGPGHMSDHPTALTTVTSSGTAPLHGSLEERFVKSSGEGNEGGTVTNGDQPETKQQDDEDHEVEDMVLDETDEDKENKG